MSRPFGYCWRMGRIAGWSTTATSGRRTPRGAPGRARPCGFWRRETPNWALHQTRPSSLFPTARLLVVVATEVAAGPVGFSSAMETTPVMTEQRHAILGRQLPADYLKYVERRLVDIAKERAGGAEQFEREANAVRARAREELEQQTGQNPFLDALLGQLGFADALQA